VLGNQAAGYFCDGRNVESWFGCIDDGADITVKTGENLGAKLVSGDEDL
jgi:hypothetical protein